MKTMIALFLLISFGVNANIVPENNLWIPADQKSQTAMSEVVFNDILDKTVEVYTPIFKKRGLRLWMSKKWSDGTVNASAMQIFGLAIVNMYGGLARHETITPDGFLLVVCHEIGHHLAGTPKVQAGVWASVEGQADYYGTAKCLRRMYSESGLIDESERTDHEWAATKCGEVHEGKEYRQCIRSLGAAQSLANLFAALRKVPAPKFETPSTEVVAETYTKHPAAQCRLDTYFQGALCDLAYDTDFDNNDEQVGACTRSKGYDLGVRSQCWFKPN